VNTNLQITSLNPGRLPLCNRFRIIAFSTWASLEVDLDRSSMWLVHSVRQRVRKRDTVTGQFPDVRHSREHNTARRPRRLWFSSPVTIEVSPKEPIQRWRYPRFGSRVANNHCRACLIQSTASHNDGNKSDPGKSLMHHRCHDASNCLECEHPGPHGAIPLRGNGEVQTATNDALLTSTLGQSNGFASTSICTTTSSAATFAEGFLASTNSN